ncbi:MAG TPA: enolase C-terminal domain-like protein [Candidatus Baltobacteraceae bacterium]
MATAGTVRVDYPISAVRARAYKIPTQEPEESDGTLKWDSTTMVVVEVYAGNTAGIGYTYGNAGIAAIVDGMLKDALVGKDALQTAARYADAIAKIRNNGREGMTAMAVSAVDIALWDLKAKVLQAPVSALIGSARERTPVYGSGGFTSYTERRLTEQLGCWVHEMHIPRVKMKVGRDPQADPRRVAAARKAIGAHAQLFVDANGAYSRKQALEMAAGFAEQDVCWYEEPVYHNDLEGNRFVRDRAPAIMEVSNGEYGYAPYQFAQIISAGAADVLQADVTRCGGYSGFLAVDALCEAHDLPLSSHCAPYVTLPVATGAKTLRHIEYFFDHVRIERMLFDGTRDPDDGCLSPDPDRPGIGLELKKADAERYAI